MCSVDCGSVCQAVQGKDPGLDNLINSHEVKHWMDPKIIPFGWGLFAEEGDEVLVLDKGNNKDITSYI